MSRQDAPLYIRSYDLACDLHRRVLSWPEATRALVGEPLASEARALVCAVALALAFPDQRAEHQRIADASLLRLRVQLRLAAALNLLTEGGADAAHDELTALGRMLGGWRKRELRRTKPQRKEEGTF